MYHSTDVELADSQVLVPGPNGYCQSVESQSIEAYFEERRPGDRISRRESVFLVQDLDDVDGAGGREGVVYKTETLGKSEVSDLAWYTEASIALGEGDTDRAHMCAKAYWAGNPYPIKSLRLPEVRCRAARVTGIAWEPEEELPQGVDVLAELKARLPLSEEAILSLLSTSAEELAVRGQDLVMAEEDTDHNPGTVALWGFGELSDRSICTLMVLSGEHLKSAVSTEQAEDIRTHPSYQQYLDRSASGEVPPPIMACRMPDGKFRSTNRRRLLVAQDLDIPIKAWVEELDALTSPCTYGDFQDALADVLSPKQPGPVAKPRMASTPGPR